MPIPYAVGLLARQAARQAAENPLAQGAAGGQTRPYADPQNQSAAHVHSFGAPVHLASGVITDCVALAQCYRVQLSGNRGVITASMLANTSLDLMGARQLNTLPPGTDVWVLVATGQTSGVILGSVPKPGTAANKGLSDALTQAARWLVDECHRLPLKMLGNGGITDWTAGRPLDSLMAGEAGWITSTGLRMAIDDFMVQMAVSEACGVFGYYHDELLRIAGHNLQLWTAGHERDCVDDQGEYNEYLGYSPYPWEHLGVFSSAANPSVELSAATFQVGQPWYSRLEPRSDRQQPFHRIQHFQGYLGQGGRQLLVARPVTPPTVMQYKPGPGAAGLGAGGSTKPADPAYVDTKFLALHEDNTGLDGRRFIRSSKGIFLAKKLLGPAPARLKRPEDGLGDTHENYKAAGALGAGPPHHITGDIETTAAPQYASLQRAAGILDLHAYLFNYAGLHPFHYHTKDYRTHEERELIAYSETNQEPQAFGALIGAMYLTAPTPKRIRIDDRYGEQEYFPNESFFGLLEDGGIVLADGFGSELRMTGGSITLSAPGDVWLKPGRNAHIWAGYDCIVKAQNGVDVSTSKRDIRLKAEQHIMALAGNSGANGGIMLESRGGPVPFNFDKVGEDVQFSGVVCRAPKSHIINWGHQIYLRTGGGEGKVLPGDIVIDADKGQRDVVTHSNRLVSFVRDRVHQFFGTEDNILTGNSFGPTGSVISSNTQIVGGLVLAGNLAMRGSLAMAGGHIGTERAKNNPFVGSLEGIDLADVYDIVARAEDDAYQYLPSKGKEYYAADPQAAYYDELRPGSDDVIKKAEFSFRSQAQYHSADFAIFEDRWQQLSRLGGSASPTWEEKFVANEIDPRTYPYPGRERFEAESYYEQNLDLFDVATGLCRDRGQDGETAQEYREPKYREPTAKPLNKNYPVTLLAQ